MKHINKNRQKKLLIFVALTIGLAIAFGFLLSKNNSPQPNVDSTGKSINLNPPTDQERKAGDDAKNAITDREQKLQQQTPSQDKNIATVIITDAGQYGDTIEVRAFMPNVYEDGTCTIIFTQGSTEVKKNTPAYKDATTTTCTNPLFSKNEFKTAGEWALSVSYDSVKNYGKSEPTKVVIK